MIKISPEAQLSLCQFLDKTNQPPNLRLVIAGETLATYHPSFLPMGLDEPSPEDTQVQVGKISVCMDARTARKAEGLSVDLVNTSAGPRLKFEFPSPVWNDPIADRLQKLIDQRINPALLSHGGYVGLVGVRNGVAEITMGGGCQGCARSKQTLNESIEAIIKREMPEIRGVVDCTDHAQGSSPYYRAESEAGASRSARRRSNRKR